MLLIRGILIQGFIIGNFTEHYEEASKQLSHHINEGKLKYKETIEDGFDNLPKAFLGMFEGKNIEKNDCGSIIYFRNKIMSA